MSNPSNRKVSVCITLWNRPDMVVKSFNQIHDDNRVSEVIISDDTSTQDNWHKTLRALGNFEKVRLFRNNTNVGVYDNKKLSVERATGEWCIVFDSDNVLTTDYLDKVFREQWYSNRALAPAFARPHFDYRPFRSVIFDKKTIKPWLYKPRFDCLLNTMNYFINRQSYIDTWQPAPDILGADSIHFNYLWLKNGGQLKVVDGLEYDHLVHSSSNYVIHVRKSEPLCRQELALIRGLT